MPHLMWSGKCGPGERGRLAALASRLVSCTASASHPDGTPLSQRAKKPPLGSPGSAGLPPAFVSAQPGPAPLPGSTGNHATRFASGAHTTVHCRWRWWVIHRRHTERIATAVHAGETPALPGGRASSAVFSAKPWPLSSNPTPAAIAPGFCFGRVHGPFLSAGLASDTIAGSSERHRYGGACGRDARAPGWGASFAVFPAQPWPFSSNLTRPAIAPGFCFGRVHAVPAGGLGACCIVGRLSESLRRCMRAGRPRSRVGRLFRSVLGTALALFLQPDSTGNRARVLLRPGSGRSRRRRWWVIHRRHTERIATAVHAGGTPALPGGRLFRSVLGTALALFLQSGSTGKHVTALLRPGSRAVPAGGVGG